MLVLAKNKAALSLLALALATTAAFAPGPTLVVAGGIIFGGITFRSPALGVAVALLASVLGEFGRLEILGTSALALDLVAPFVLLVWFARKLLKKEKFLLDGVSSGLLAFWGVALLSLIFGAAELSGSELKFAAFHFLRFVGVSGVLLVARDFSKKESARGANALLGVGVLLALAGFVLLRSFPDFAEAGLTDLGWDPHIGRLATTFLDPNFASGAFAFLLALLGGRLLRERNFARQSLLLLLAGILGGALLLTFSRSGLLALAVGGVILGVLGSRKILLALVIVGILGFAGSGRLRERAGELWQSAASLGGESQQVLDPTAQLRAESWQEGLQVWRENPILGVGFGAYKFHQTFAEEDSHAASGSDSSLLNVLATTGVLGGGAFLFFLAELTRFAFRRKEWGFLAALGGILVHSVFVNSLFFPPLALYLFVSGGLAVRKK